MIEVERLPLYRDKVYDALLDAIISGRLRPGERIRERTLAESMGLSTTPIKEAIRRLETDGLVISEPRRGAVVSDAALTSVREIVHIRADLEGFGARLAAQKLDSDGRRELDEVVNRMRDSTEPSPDVNAVIANNALFHRLIRTTTKNRFIVHFVDVLSAFDRSVRQAALNDPAEAVRGLAEHLAIYESICEGDGDAAEEQMRLHILRTIDFVLEAQSRSEAEAADAGRPAGYRPETQ